MSTNFIAGEYYWVKPGALEDWVVVQAVRYDGAAYQFGTSPGGICFKFIGNDQFLFSGSWSANAIHIKKPK